MEGLKVSDADMEVYLHPSKSKKVSQAILRELSSLLFKFVHFPFTSLHHLYNNNNNYYYYYLFC